MKSISPPNKILIIAPSWVGDLVMAQALFRLLKQNNPNCSIDVLAAKSMHSLLDRMPEVNQKLDLPFAHGELNLAGRFRLAKQLRAIKYDQAIILPNSWKSALIPFWSKIPKRTGWLGEMRYLLLNDARKLLPDKLPLMVERFIALGLAPNAALPSTLPLPKLITNQKQCVASLTRLQLDAAKPIIAFCPGAEFGPSKRWPTKYFAEVAKVKNQEGYAIWIFGGPKDKILAEEINYYCNNVCVDLTGKTNLGEAVDLLSLAKIVVTNDTGLMHVAAAVGCKIIAIYGSSSPKFTPPLTDKVTILSLNLPCSPCFKRECLFKHTNCLWEMKPEKILTAMAEL